MIQFRKDKKTGAWKVIGPATEVVVGSVSVRKADGSTTTAQVTSVSRAFDVDGTPTVYGTLAPKADAHKTNFYAKGAGYRTNAPRNWGTGGRGGWRPCGYPGCNPGHCDECSD